MFLFLTFHKFLKSSFILLDLSFFLSRMVRYSYTFTQAYASLCAYVGMHLIHFGVGGYCPCLRSLRKQMWNIRPWPDPGGHLVVIRNFQLDKELTSCWQTIKINSVSDNVKLLFSKLSGCSKTHSYGSCFRKLHKSHKERHFMS